MNASCGCSVRGQCHVHRNETIIVQEQFMKGLAAMKPAHKQIETKEQKATLAELIYRSQKGEEIEIGNDAGTWLGVKLEDILPDTIDLKELHLLRFYRIKPRTVTITREQLAEAWDNSAILKDGAEKSVMFQTLCKKLGLSRD